MNCLHVYLLIFIASALCAVAVAAEVPTCPFSDEDQSTSVSAGVGHHKGTSYALLQKAAYLQDSQEKSRRLLENSAQATQGEVGPPRILTLVFQAGGQSSNNTELTSSKVDIAKSSLAHDKFLSKDSVAYQLESRRSSRRRSRRRRKSTMLTKMETDDVETNDALDHMPKIRKTKTITQRSLEERRTSSGLDEQKDGLHTPPLTTAFHVLGGSSKSNASQRNALHGRAARTGELGEHGMGAIGEMNVSIEDADGIEQESASDESLVEDIPQYTNSSDDPDDAALDSLEVVEQKGSGASDMRVAKETLANRRKTEAEAKAEARVAKAAAHDAAIQTKNAERILGEAKAAENTAFAKVDESEIAAKAALEKQTEAERVLAERIHQMETAASSTETEKQHIQKAKSAREAAEKDAQRMAEEARLAAARFSEQKKHMETLTAHKAEATKTLSEKQEAEKDALVKVTNMEEEADKSAQSVEMAAKKVQKASGMLKTATENARAAAEAEQKAKKALEEAQVIELGNKKAADMATRKLAEEQARKEESSVNRLAAEKVVEDFNSNETKTMKELADAKIAAEKKLAEQKLSDQAVSDKKTEEKEAEEKVSKEDELAKKVADEKLDAEKLVKESLEASKHSNDTLLAEKDVAEKRVAERQKAEAEVTEKRNAEKDATLKAKALAEAGQSATEERANAEVAVARKTITRAASEIWKGKSRVPLYDWAAALWNGS